GLERDLRLVAAVRADHREIFPGDVVVATLVAARPTDVPDVVSGLPTGPATCAAARAALGVRRKPLLCVVLLIGGRADELHPAVDAVQRSIGVGHETFLSSWRGSSPACLTRAAMTAAGKAESVGVGEPAPLVQVPYGVPVSGARVIGRVTIHPEADLGL